MQLQNYRTRPVYTSQELSVMIRKKRSEEQLSEKEFSDKHQIPVPDLQKLESGTCCFSPKQYRACGRILDIPDSELIAEYADDLSAVLKGNLSDTACQTVFLANRIWNQIIMQQKLASHINE